MKEVFITDKAIAGRVSDILIDVYGKLTQSVAVVHEACSEEESIFYRTAVYASLGELFDIAKPLYDSHPELKPPGLFEKV